jgi:hypothetical protein
MSRPAVEISLHYGRDLPWRFHSRPLFLKIPWLRWHRFFHRHFSCQQQHGVLWLHGYGNVFDVLLGPGESIDIEPGGWIYKDQSVQMQTITQRLSTGFFASAGQLFFNRFAGPGRVGIQSMYLHMPTTE